MALTITDIAQELGVAASTVSNVLNGRCKGTYPKAAARAERIRAYAAEHGYRPSAAARAVRAQRTFQVGMLLPNRPGHPFTHPNAFEAMLGLNSGLQVAGYVVSIIRFDDVTRNVASHTKLFSEQALDGLVVCGWYPTWAQPALEGLVERIVWMDTQVWHKTGCIRRNEGAAGREAARRALEMGYRRLLWVGYPEQSKYGHYSHVGRLSGALAQAEAAGLELAKVEMIPQDGVSDAWAEVEQQLSPQTVAIAETVYHAQALANHVGAMGLAAPRDFGLVCCDSSQETDRLFPRLSRVSFNRFEMGRVAAAMMLSMIEQEDKPATSRTLRGSWIEGATMRPPAERRRSAT